MPAVEVGVPWSRTIHEGLVDVEVAAYAVGESGRPFVGISLGPHGDRRLLTFWTGAELAGLTAAIAAASVLAWGDEGDPFEPCLTGAQLAERLERFGLQLDMLRVNAALQVALHSLEAAARSGDAQAYKALRKVVGAFNATPELGEKVG